MDDDQRPIHSAARDKSLARRGSITALVFLLIALYVLSIGPAWCLRKRDVLPDGAFIALYLPVLLPSQSSRYDEILTAYRDWWLAKFG